MRRVEGEFACGAVIFDGRRAAGEVEVMSADEGEGYFRIGQVAKKTGVSKRTLRYYEEEGLLTPADSTEGGFRLYTARQIHRVRVIRFFQDMGFSLSEVGEILLPEPDGDKDEQLDHSRRVLHVQKEAIEERVKELKEKRMRVERALRFLADCEECGQDLCPPDCRRRGAFL